MHPQPNVNLVSHDSAISETLTRLRTEKGLTPMQLAKLSGVNLLTINLYESPYYEQYEIKTLTRIVESCGGKLTLSISSANP